MITEQDKELIEKAKLLAASKKVYGGVIKEVGCALRTHKNKIFTGVSIHVSCGIGFCAEHSAVAAMLGQTDETYIKTIVACNQETIIPPCGRCREFLNLIDEKNLATEVIIEQDKKVALRELLPYAIVKN